MSNQSMLDLVQRYYNAHGPRKPMGTSSPSKTEPHFFLVRSFLGETDLAILFNTKRCRYQCKFCSLPAKSSKEFIPADDIAAQYLGVLDRVKHAIGVFERLTIANEGSVLDAETFPRTTLREIVESSSAIPNLSRVVIESRLEFVEVETLQDLRHLSGGKSIDVLTGFESADTRIREDVLGKHEPLDRVLAGLDRVAEAGCALTAYVLYKPDPRMTDQEAYLEAERSIDFLAEQTSRRCIPLCIRLNPMYVSRGTEWERRAMLLDYRPPKLGDVLTLARRKDEQGIPIYLGLTSEGLADEDKTYRAREDFSKGLLKDAIRWNRRKTSVSRIPSLDQTASGVNVTDSRPALPTNGA